MIDEENDAMVSSIENIRVAMDSFQESSTGSDIIETLRSKYDALESEYNKETMTDFLGWVNFIQDQLVEIQRELCSISETGFGLLGEIFNKEN